MHSKIQCSTISVQLSEFLLINQQVNLFVPFCFGPAGKAFSIISGGHEKHKVHEKTHTYFLNWKCEMKYEINLYNILQIFFFYNYLDLK